MCVFALHYFCCILQKVCTCLLADVNFTVHLCSYVKRASTQFKVDISFSFYVKQIPAPVDGILHVDGGTRVVIKPTEKQFEGTEIILENINPVSEADGKRFSPGDEIGSASKIDLCGDNFIHLSVRETKNGTFPDDEFDYIDPSGLLDDFNPLSKWVQECMDYEFR